MKYLIFFSILLFPLLALNAPSDRPFVRWTDDKGTIHFTDDPNKIPAEFRKKSEPINASRYANQKARSCTFTFQPGLDKVIISGKLNEGTPGKFLIDAQSPQSMISAKYAQSLGFNPSDPNLKKVDIITSSEKISAPLAKVNRVDLQGCETLNMYFAISDFAESPDYNGILGKDFFSKFRSSLDLSGGKIVLEDLK